MTKLEKGLFIALAAILMMIVVTTCTLIADTCKACDVTVDNTVKIMLPDVESEPLERIPEPIDILVDEYKEEIVNEPVEPSKGVVSDSEEGEIVENEESVETVETKIERFVESVTEEAETVVEERVDEKDRYFDIPLDESLQDHIRGLCEEYGVDMTVILAMIDRESKFDIYAVGDNGRALGLMQIHPRWHEARMSKLECWDLMDSYQNMTVAVDFIAELAASGNSIEWVLMAYNGGEAYADRKVADGEVSDYAVEVLAEAERYW